MAEDIKQLRSAGGDYTSIQDWWDTECKAYDCVTNQISPVLECYDDWASGLNEQIILAEGTGYSANSTYHPIIRCASGHRHNGIPQSGFYISRLASYASIIELDAYYLEIDGIDVENLSTSYGRGFRKSVNSVARSTSTTIKNCIARAADDQAAFENLVGTNDYNNLAWGSDLGFQSLNWYDVTLSNCVAVDCLSGFKNLANSDSTLRNCVAYGCATSFDGSRWASSTNNAASDGATITPPGSNPYTSNVVAGDFEGAANDDYHLSSNSNLVGLGANLYSEFQTDIDGDLYPATGAWPIGFDHVAIAAGTTVGVDAYSETEVFNDVAVIDNVGVTVDQYSDVELFGDVSILVGESILVAAFVEADTFNGIGVLSDIAIGVDAYTESELYNDVQVISESGTTVVVDGWTRVEQFNDVTVLSDTAIEVDGWVETEAYNGVVIASGVSISCDGFIESDVFNDVSLLREPVINIGMVTESEVFNDISVGVGFHNWMQITDADEAWSAIFSTTNVWHNI